MKRVAAGCETSALWQWLEANSGKNVFDLLPVAEELLDQEGSTAIHHACDIGNSGKRESVSNALLCAYSKKDAWAAYETYKELRSHFGSKWGNETVCSAFQAACGISADRLITCMEECPGKGSPEWIHFSGTTSPFAQGFEFQKLLNHLASAKEPPLFLPDDLPGFWMKQDPVAAVSWYLTSRSGGGYFLGDARMALVSGPFNSDSMKSVITGSASREERLAALRLIPEKNRNELWTALLSGRWAAGESGVLDPKFLDVADATTGREELLTTKLLETRGLAELDPSFSIVPTQEREAIIQKCLTQWKKDEPMSLADGAREQWQVWIRREWR